MFSPNIPMDTRASQDISRLESEIEFRSKIDEACDKVVSEHLSANGSPKSSRKPTP